MSKKIIFLLHILEFVLLVTWSLASPSHLHHKMWKRQSTDSGKCVLGSDCGLYENKIHTLCSINIDHHKFDNVKESLSLLKDECPQLFTPESELPEVCCSSEELNYLQSSINMMRNAVSDCKACWKIVAELFCHLSCAPNQNNFLEITSTTQLSNGSRADSIEVYISRQIINDLFKSCESVKPFGLMMNHLCGKSTCDISKLSNLTIFSRKFGAPADTTLYLIDDEKFINSVTGKTFMPVKFPTESGTC